MIDNKIHSDPSDVSAEADEVIVDGPDGVAVSLTPDAAIETSNRLFDAGAEARGKKIMQGVREARPIEDSEQAP